MGRYAAATYLRLAKFLEWMAAVCATESARFLVMG